MNRFVREPLVHFLLIGGLLFAIHARWGGAGNSGKSDREIVVTTARENHLAATFERVWQRPPTGGELQGLIDDYVRDEVYVREALRLGLDQDDTVIRQRLRQQMEFIGDDMFQPPTPTDGELEQFLKDNPKWFERDAEYTFQHVYFNTEQRGDAAIPDARAALAKLKAGGTGVDSNSLGDSFVMGQEFQSATTSFIARMFGDEFVKNLRALEPGSWQGPVQSGYGVHLVKIDSLKPGRLPPFSEVRDAVLNEWADRKRAEANEAYFQSLKKKYVISVESRTGGQIPAKATNPQP